MSPCGGGYGEPLERDPQRVLDDVLDGFISRESAREYGVVITEALAIDPSATEELRSRLRARK